MTNKKVNSILKQVLEKVEPPKEELEEIRDFLEDFIKKLEKRLKTLKIGAEIFVGGSFAKKTLIKKDCYDIDVFIRFPKKYKDNEISGLTGKILKGVGKVSMIHGSRDYFRINKNPGLFLEIIPVIKVKNPREAENITDLSYSHVNYVKKKIKGKHLEEIRLAKAFCYGNNCYGAESYISGFSGYGLELLIYYYGGFLKFIKEIVKDKGKVVIDIEKQFKNKQEILMNLNSSKLHSPIILIDPTYKQRNVLAALSKETFEKFKKDCEKFLKNPSIKSFEIEKADLEKIKRDAKKKKFEFILVKLKTNRQEGDIAGNKLLKFYKHLSNEIEKSFEIKNKGFDYDGKKSSECFFVVKSKKEILISGPNAKDIKNVKMFKKKHKNTFIKSKKIHAKEKIRFSIKEFISKWKTKNKDRLKDMSIINLEI